MEAQMHRPHAGQHHDEANSVNDSATVRSGMVEPTVMGTPVLAEDLYATHSDIVDPPVRSFADWEEEERHGAPPPLSTHYEPHLTDLPRVAAHQDVNTEQPPGFYASATTDLPPVSGHAYGDQGLDRELLMPSIRKSTGMDEGSITPNPTTTVTPADSQARVPHTMNTGENEVGITDVLRSLDKMKVYEEPNTKPTEPDQNELPNVHTGSHNQFAPETVKNPPLDTIAADPSNPNSSYTQRLSSATTAIADKAVAVKDSIVSKLSSSGETTHKRSTFPTELSHKVADTLSSTLGPVYEKVAGAGEGKGYGVKEYLVETFKPGDDDKVLSEAITHAFHRGKGNELQQETSTTSTTTYVIRDEGERGVQDSSN